jgi:hypothetical protein
MTHPGNANPKRFAILFGADKLQDVKVAGEVMPAMKTEARLNHFAYHLLV